MKREYKNCKRALVPFHIIEKASGGDAESINLILKHYKNYIVSLSTRRFFDEYGHAYFGVDETLRRCLETKLITKILQFEVA